jgi:hypothetical protein
MPRMRVRDPGQVVREGRSVVSMAISGAPRHLIAAADAYALHGITAYHGPAVSGSLQPRGQAVLQIWPRAAPEQERGDPEQGHGDQEQSRDAGRAPSSRMHESEADALGHRVSHVQQRLQPARESLQIEWDMNRADQRESYARAHK